MTMRKVNVSSELLRSIADAIEVLTDAELEVLLQGIGFKRMVAASRSKSSKEAVAKEQNSHVLSSASSLLSGLHATTTREEAFSVLRSAKPNKNVLLQAARSLDIYVDRADRIGDIVDKLVAHTVGSRLDSAAIRGSDGASTQGR